MFSQQLASLVIHTVGGSGEKAGVVGGEKRGESMSHDRRDWWSSLLPSFQLLKKQS